MMDTIQNALNHVWTGPYPWIGGGAMLLLLAMWLRARHQPAAIVAFDNPDGQVKVSRSAINELAQSATDDISEVAKCVTRIQTRGGRLNVQLRIKMVAGSNLSEVSLALQNRVKNSLRHGLGIEKLGSIEVRLTGFIGQNKQAPAYLHAERTSQPAEVESVEEPAIDETSEEKKEE